MRIGTIVFFIFMALVPALSRGRCSAGDCCRACTTCNGCVHCAKRGGSCSVCSKKYSDKNCDPSTRRVEEIVPIKTVDDFPAFEHPTDWPKTIVLIVSIITGIFIVRAAMINSENHNKKKL